MTEETGVAESQPSKANGEDQDMRGSDDLDSLLSEYESSPGAEEAPKGGQHDQLLSRLSNVEKLLERTEREASQREYAESMKEAAEYLQGEDLKYLPPRVLEGWLNLEAQSDERMRRAYNDRIANPQNWKRILKAKHNQLQEMIGSPVDRKATEDVKAVEAAVRSASSTKGSDKPKYSKKQLDTMTDSEFFEAYDKGLLSEE